MARAMELDERISYDGSSFRAIPDGVWPFSVKAVVIENYNGGDNIPPCRNAKVTLHIGVGSDVTDVTDNIFLYYNDYGNPNWRISAFYRAIGYKKHGEEVAMNWTEQFLVGKTGWARTTQREFVFTKGQRKGETGISIDVDYIDPEDAPVDGQPKLDAPKANQPQQAAPQQVVPQPPMQQPVQQAVPQQPVVYQQPVQYQPVQQAAQNTAPYNGGGQWTGL